jgi:hypothetical protein
MERRTVKMSLNRETLRVLSDAQLMDAAGGQQTAQCPTVNLAACESALPSCYCVWITYNGCGG